MVDAGVALGPHSGSSWVISHDVTLFSRECICTDRRSPQVGHVDTGAFGGNGERKQEREKREEWVLYGQQTLSWFPACMFLIWFSSLCDVCTVSSAPTLNSCPKRLRAAEHERLSEATSDPAARAAGPEDRRGLCLTGLGDGVVCVCLSVCLTFMRKPCGAASLFLSPLLSRSGTLPS